MLEISEKTQGELAQFVRLVEDPKTPWGLAWHALSQLARKGQFQLDWARYYQRFAQVPRPLPTIFVENLLGAFKQSDFYPAPEACAVFFRDLLRDPRADIDLDLGNFPAPRLIPRAVWLQEILPQNPRHVEAVLTQFTLTAREHRDLWARLLPRLLESHDEDSWYKIARLLDKQPRQAWHPRGQRQQLSSERIADIALCLQYLPADKANALLCRIERNLARMHFDLADIAPGGHPGARWLRLTGQHAHTLMALADGLDLKRWDPVAQRDWWRAMLAGDPQQDIANTPTP